MIAASVGGVTAILVDSLFNYQFAVPPTYILLFTLLAIPSMLHDEGFEKASLDRPPAAVPARHHPWQVAWKLASSVTIVVAAAALLWQQTRVLTSEHLYQMALDLENQNDVANAEAGFRRSVELNNLNGRAHFGLSRVLSSRGHASEALAELERAEQTYADSHQEVLRGVILEQMGKNGAALAAYRHAVWLDPTLSSAQQDIGGLNKTRSGQRQ
jgi:tetratricopeptide (TPR) repeat protein